MNPFLVWKVLSPAHISGISYICLSLEEDVCFFFCKLHLPIGELSHAFCYKAVFSVFAFMSILFIGCPLLWCLCCKARSGNGEGDHPKDPVFKVQGLLAFLRRWSEVMRGLLGFHQHTCIKVEQKAGELSLWLKGAGLLGKGEGWLELNVSSIVSVLGASLLEVRNKQPCHDSSDGPAP